MLEIQNLSKSFPTARGPVQALAGLSFSLRPGQFIAVRGPSGCGKSTLLLAAGGLLRPDQGRVRVHGQDLYALSSEQRAAFRAGHIGFVFQRFHLVPYLNVLDNILAPALTGAGQDLRARAHELIARFGLQDRIGSYPAQLSTGERQRTALARALLRKPALLLADEPTGNLDPDNAQQVLRSLCEFAQSGGAVLLVTHDPAAAQQATATLHMNQGRLQTTVQNVITSPA